MVGTVIYVGAIKVKNEVSQAWENTVSFFSKEDKEKKTKGDSDTEIKAGDETAKGREFSKHGAEQANDRDFSSKNVDDIIDNNKKTRVKEITDEGEVRWRYQDKRGNTVITNESSGRVITVYSHPASANGGKYIPK